MADGARRRTRAGEPPSGVDSDRTHRRSSAELYHRHTLSDIAAPRHLPTTRGERPAYVRGVDELSRRTGAARPPRRARLPRPRHHGRGVAQAFRSRDHHDHRRGYGDSWCRTMVAVFGFLLAMPSGAPARNSRSRPGPAPPRRSSGVHRGRWRVTASAEGSGFLQVGRTARLHGRTRRCRQGGRRPATGQARICSEDYGGPQTRADHRHRQRQAGHPRVTRSDGCGIADWQTLRPLLGDPERRGRIPRPPKRPAPSTTVPAVEHLVQRGETLTVIARRFGTTIGAITERNQLDDPDNLAEGQRLVIPEPSSVQLVRDAARRGGNGSGFAFTLTGVQPGNRSCSRSTFPTARRSPARRTSPRSTARWRPPTRRASAPASTASSPRRRGHRCRDPLPCRSGRG